MKITRRQLRNAILKEMRAGNMMGGRASSVRFDLPGGKDNVYEYIRQTIDELSETMTNAVRGGKLQNIGGSYDDAFLRIAQLLRKEQQAMGMDLKATRGLQGSPDRLLNKLKLTLRICSDYKEVTRNPRDRFCMDIESKVSSLIGVIRKLFKV